MATAVAVFVLRLGGGGCTLFVDFGNLHPCKKTHPNDRSVVFFAVFFVVAVVIDRKKVSVPMELRLTVKKSGTDRKGDGPEPAGHWQQLTKVVQNAHRPVVFEVDGLIPDTRCSVQENSS